MTKQEAMTKMAEMIAAGKKASAARDALYSAAAAEGFWGEDSMVLTRLTDAIELAKHGSHEAWADAAEASSKAAARSLTPMTAGEMSALYAATDYQD